ncbi:MAG: hypothetical protein AAFX93_10685 [Verrucomicrobiota bacterium]
MRRVVSLLVFAFCVNAHAHDFRVWEDVDGRTITAKVVRLDDEKVVVVRENDVDLAGNPRQYELPITRFSEADVAYVEALREQLIAVQEDFDALKKKFPPNVRKFYKFRSSHNYEGRDIQRAPFFVSDAIYNEYQGLAENLDLFGFSYDIEILESKAASYAEAYKPKTEILSKSTVQLMHNRYWIQEFFIPYIEKLKELDSTVQGSIE